MSAAPTRRVVAHLDVDAFYASVELLRRPELRGKPVVVAGTGPRSVVTTASYEARRYGIDSAMSAARARTLCPQAIFIPPDFDAYRAKSRTLWAIVRGRVERVQQMGLDEAYLDLTGVERPLALLRELVAQARELTGLTVSVGVGPSRLVAKTVSAAYKPAAFVAMSREQACEQFAGAPVRVLQGIGPKTAERLREHGIATVGDLQRAFAAALAERFGARLGGELHARAHFHDDSPVETARVVKSRSVETTFPADVADQAELERVLERQCGELCEQLARRGKRGRTIAIKVRLDDWTTITRARSIDEFTNDHELVTGIALGLLRAYAPPRPVRLLGVRVAAFEGVAQIPEAEPHAAGAQLTLPFADELRVGASSVPASTPAASG